MKKALILTDIQYDFVPGGALAVPKGDEIVPVANRLMPEYDLIIATQDWHPADHKSFASQHPGKKIGEQLFREGLRAGQAAGKGNHSRNTLCHLQDLPDEGVFHGRGCL